MYELPLIFVAGLLGSSHCIGMCGPFALAIGGSSNRVGNNFARQLVYSVGRIFTYVFLGAVAGFGGWRVTAAVPETVNISAIFAIAAGLLLVWQGLAATGIFRRKNSKPGGVCLAGGLLANFLKNPSTGSLFLAGLFTGFLPCGLVYAFLAMAASTAHFGWGAATMLAFGLGTTPIMVLTGVGGSLLNMTLRQRMLKVAAVCVIITGGISVARGAGYLSTDDTGKVQGCPMCRESELNR